MALYQHQELIVKEMIDKKRLACFADMGTGKSLCALAAIDRLKENALIVCCNYLKRTWLAECQKWYPRLKVMMIDGDAAKRKAQIAADAQIKIINYEGARIEEEALTAMQGHSGRACSILVLDESQSVKSIKAAQTKTILKLSRSIPYIWLLTGTPITNTFQDMYSQYKIIMPEHFRTLSDFKNRFLILGGYLGKQVIGNKNIDEFKRITDANTIRLKKEDCLNLPKKIYQTIYTEMSPKQAAAYHQMKEESIVMLDKAEPSAVAEMAVIRLMRLRQIASGGWCGQVHEDGRKEIITVEANPPKVATLAEMVAANWEGGHNMLIWTAYRHDIKLISEALSKTGVMYSTIQGETSPAERQERIDAFQKKDLNVLIINNSIVAGMTLTAADLVFYYANGYNYAARAQSEDRCHRIGQNKPVTYIDLTAQGTVEESIRKVLDKKGDIAKIVDKNAWREIFLGGI